MVSGVLRALGRITGPLDLGMAFGKITVTRFKIPGMNQLSNVIDSQDLWNGKLDPLGEWLHAEKSASRAVYKHKKAAHWYLPSTPR